MSIINKLAEAGGIVSGITKEEIKDQVSAAYEIVSSLKKSPEIKDKALLIKNVNLLKSVGTALEDKAISYKSATALLANFRPDMTKLSHGCIDVLTDNSRYVTESAITGKPVTVLKDFSELGKILENLKPIQKQIKGVEAANGVDSRTQGEKEEWESYDASQYAYEEGMHKDAIAQKTKIDMHAQKLPPYSKLNAGIKKSGWSIFKGPVLVVFAKAPTRAALQRTRIKIDHLTLNSHLAEKIRNDVSRLGSIVEDQMVIALPSSLVRDKEQFEEEKSIAIASLSNRLGDLVPVTRSPATVEKVSRATELTKVSFEHIRAPVAPVKPVQPTLEGADRKKASGLIKYKKLMKKYESDMKEYDAKNAAYKEEKKKYNREFKSNQRNLDKVKEKERQKLRVSREDYFMDKKYPGMVFVWLMPKVIYSSLMPMRFSSIGFPSTGEVAVPEEYLEEKRGAKIQNELLVPTQQAMISLLDNIKSIQDKARKKVGSLTALEVSLNSALRNLQKVNPKSPNYMTLKGTIENIKMAIEKLKREIDDIHNVDIPSVRLSANSLKGMAKNLLEEEKK